MGDINIAADILSGVTDALGDLGTSRTVRIFTEGVLDPLNPGAGKPRVSEDFPVEALLYDYKDDYINETSILAGDRKAILSIEPLSQAQIDGIQQGSFVIDGTTTYTVVNLQKIEVAGIIVTIILQIREV
jgi:hypothetical protein